MSVYEDYIKKFPEVDDSSLADIMIKDGVVSGRKKSVRDRLARLKRKMIESTKREDRYIFNLPGKTIEIPNEAVEVLFRRYPSSKTTVDDCRKFLLNDFDIYISDCDTRKIFKELGLSKRGSFIPPHMRNASVEDIDEYQEEAQRLEIEERIFARRDDVFKKLYEEEREKNIDLEEFIDTAIERISEVDLPSWGIACGNHSGEPSSDLVLVLSDWHVGLLTNVGNTEYNSDIFKDRVLNLARGISSNAGSVQDNLSEVHVFILGDIVDSVLRNMHDNQHYSQDLYGIDQALVASSGLTMIIDCLVKTFNVPVNVHSVGGNHGRVTPSRNGDPTRIGDQAAYAISEGVITERHPDVSWNMERVSNFIRTNIQGVNIMACHGDNMPKDLKSAAWANLTDGVVDTIFLSGHYHTYSIQQGTNITTIRNGSLCGGNQFSEDVVAERSEPCQIMFEMSGGKIVRTYNLFV